VTAFHDPSLGPSHAVATLEAAGREVVELQRAGEVHLKAYQANLLNGERAAADASLAEVTKCRDQTAKAARGVRDLARSIDPLIARCSSLYAECIRLAPLTEAALLLARQDIGTINRLLTGTSWQGSKARDDVAKILTSLPREGEV